MALQMYIKMSSNLRQWRRCMHVQPRIAVLVVILLNKLFPLQAAEEPEEDDEIEIYLEGSEEATPHKKKAKYGTFVN